MATDRRVWSRAEVEAVVADYLDMLGKEIRGEAFSKAQHRRRLMKVLDRRTDGSIEYKRENITAVLNTLGFPGIEGYKPAANFQGLLLEVVRETLAGADVFLSLVGAEVEKPAQVPGVDDLLARLVKPPPRRNRRRYPLVRDRDEPVPTETNCLVTEARNASLGSAGEEFVLNFERARLLAEHRENLAADIEHVSRTRGDHEGFDVLSFETDGRERLIEVKTTAFGALTPFFVSANQVRQSRSRQDEYHVYRVFRFRKDPHLFALRGAIDENFNLEAKEFMAVLA